jgi:hypothetical protein
MFCAVWTILLAIFSLLVAAHGIMGYIRLGAEGIAVLSWFAGFIAVAVNIGNGVCAAKAKTCSTMEAATVFGGLEWILFVITAFFTFRLVFTGGRHHHKTVPSAI